MLQREYCRGNKYCTLLSVRDTLKRGAQRNLGFAEADISAQQPVHREGLLHIVLDFIDTAKLVISFVKFKAPFKIALHVYVRRKAETRRLHTLGIKSNQLLCHILHRGAYSRARLFPFLAAETVQLYPRILVMRSYVL